VRLLSTLAGLAVAVAPLRAPATTPLEVAPHEVRFRLDDPAAAAPGVDWLLSFRDASIERPGPWRLYASSKWGAWTEKPWLALDWRAPEPTAPVEPEPPFEIQLELPAPESLLSDRAFLERVNPSPLFDFTGPSLTTDGLSSIFVLPPTKPIVDWRCRRRPVTIVRYGGESEKLDLVRCDGSMAPGALDTLSILARPPEAQRPDGGLPDEPDGAAWSARREWVEGVRIVHPRLVWAVQRIADAFPGKPIYVYSGYRPLAEVNDGSGHKSMHAEGRALDISILRVQNEKLFEVCRELKDVACGFYPNSKFVHVGVRRAHSGKSMWIDASMPGEPAQYVDSWPGVVDKGALAWRPQTPTTSSQ
jgi:hypothetical protein